MVEQFKWWIIFILGFYLCCVLMVLPLPVHFQWYRPQWLLLFIIFCQLEQPTSFNPFYAWCGGLIQDSLLGTPLGQYALIFALISYLTALMRSRFVRKPLWMQWGKIFLLVALSQILMLWFHALEGQNPHSLEYWMGSVISCLAWPLVVFIFQGWSKLFGTHSSNSR